MKPAPFEFTRATRLEDAAVALEAAGGEGRPYAGGQSLGPMLNFRVARPTLLVDLSEVAALQGQEFVDGGIEVGAMSVHSDFEDGKITDVAKGLLQHTASGIAYRAVRNRGTIGGSLSHADPAADWPPVMMALDAIGQIYNTQGGYEVPVSEFINGILSTVMSPGDILAKIKIPQLSETATWGHYKICVKPGDFAQSLSIVLMDRENDLCRVVLAGPSSPATYLKSIPELLLSSGEWSADLAEKVKEVTIHELELNQFIDPADGYNRNLHGTVVVRAAKQAMCQ